MDKLILKELWNLYSITFALFFHFRMHWPRNSFWFCFFPISIFTISHVKEKKNQIKVYMICPKHYFTNPINSSTKGKMESGFTYPYDLRTCLLWIVVLDGGINALLNFMRHNPIIFWPQLPIKSPKTTITLKKLKSWKHFNHKAPIEFWTYIEN